MSEYLLWQVLLFYGDIKVVDIARFQLSAVTLSLLCHRDKNQRNYSGQSQCKDFDQLIQWTTVQENANYFQHSSENYLTWESVLLSTHSGAQYI